MASGSSTPYQFQNLTLFDPWVVCPGLSLVIMQQIILLHYVINHYHNVILKLFNENVYNIINYLKECGLFKKF